MKVKPLKELYTDHEGKVSDKWQIYLTEYERIFKNFRSKSVKLLEIGIQNGGSLEILSKYFSKGEKFIGCDIDPRCLSLQYEDPRISIVVGDACQKSIQARIFDHCQEFDIVIDDGSHHSKDIVEAFTKYFPSIVNGGIFVAEDLHCSYWQEYGGGLFAPFSAISFFKFLADIINYDHWGTGNKRAEILNEFSEEYNIELNEEVLCLIHSVEFINSLCIVKKNSPNKNKLGKRIIAGQIEDVFPSRNQFSNNSLHVPNQKDNHLSSITSSPYQELLIVIKEINELKKILEERNNEVGALEQTIIDKEMQINALLKSSSWRITAPLRLAVQLLKLSKRLIPWIQHVAQIKGGYQTIIGESLSIMKNEGLSGIRSRLWYLINDSSINRNDYKEWIRRYDSLTDENRNRMCKFIKAFKHTPFISIVLTTDNPNHERLVETIESVREQIYPNWQLCIADNASRNKSVVDTLERYAFEDRRIKVVCLKNRTNICAISNDALKLASGDYVALLNQEDILAKHALFCIANALNANPDSMLLYSDEDKIDEIGSRSDPHFKCDWNPELFYSYNIIGHLAVYKTDLVRKLGGFREGFEGSQDYDLALRFVERIEPEQIMHIPRVLYYKRVNKGIRADAYRLESDESVAAQRAIIDHLRRKGVDGKVDLLDFGMFRVRYALPKKNPLVSIIIPTRNSLDLIRRCIESIYEKTTYRNFEIIIVDNGSKDADALSYFSELQHSGKARILRDDGPFNYSALNNAAVCSAHGELVCLLNNDIEVITPHWLDEMVSLALQPGVGAVGARLWYPNNTLQHGGVVVGLGGVAGHAHRHLPKGSPGYYSRAELIQNFSAVTAACMVIRKKIFQQVNGLNEDELKVAYNDVDFCLKVQQKGYRNVWTPYAELYHHEYASRGNDDTPEKMARYNKEVTYIKKVWGFILQNDPCYNPNLTLRHEDFSLSWPPRFDIFQTPIVKFSKTLEQKHVVDDNFKPLVFVHIPKTAGTSFRIGLENTIGAEYICKDYGARYEGTSSCVIDYWEKKDLSIFRKEFDRIGYKVLSGHFNAAKYANIFPLPSMVTFLRDPIARIVSEFKHFQRNLNYKGTIEDFYCSKKKNNLQWKLLSKVYWQALGMVGITERYEESLELFEYLFGLKLPFLRSNINPDIANLDNDISPDLKSQIEKNNQDDILLYNRAIKEFESQMSMMKKNQPYTHSHLRVNNKGRLSGWAFRRESDEPVSMRLLIDAKEFKVMTASDYNRTMHRHGCPRRGHIGFSVKLPSNLIGSALQCEVVDTGQCLTISD